MLTLNYLKPARIAVRLKRQHLSGPTGISVERLTDLDLRRAEPWFDEALTLHRVLNTAGINDLFLPQGTPLTAVDDSHPRDADLREWRSGTRAPLSLAVRIAIGFGLEDPVHLATTDLMRQMWDVLASSERHPEAPGWCPWCGADTFSGDGHLPTCLPNNILTARGRAGVGADDERLAYMVKPATKVKRGPSAKAYGLKALRETAGLTQTELANAVHLSPNYYARLERAEFPLTPEKAAILAAQYNVHPTVLYARPAHEAGASA